MPVKINSAINTADVVFNIPVDQRFTYRIPEHMEDLVFPGQRVRVPFGRRSMLGYVVEKNYRHTTQILKDIQGCLDKKPLLTDELLHLAQWIAQEYACSEGEALSAFFSPQHILKKPVREKQYAPLTQGTGPSFTLTHEQANILHDINLSFEKRESRTFLIHGVTGSGKTEVYLRAITSVIEQGRQAVYLVPEISMTPLFIDRLKERFGCMVALWHSRLPVRERVAVWHAVLEGNIRIIIGARSAIFVPFQNIGVIIIDEEHDDSYKQDKKPYYHARRIAEKRAETHNAALVLGSATPSLESYRKALQGTYTLLHLRERIDKRPMPEVHMVYLAGEKIGRMPEIFSEKLTKAIRQRLARREQVILFLNRRGYAPFIRCSACGWVGSCSQCSVSLVYHRESAESKDRGGHGDFFALQEEHRYSHKLIERPDPSGYTERLICHYCGKVTPLPQSCPSCAKDSLRLAGVGTQKVESELRRLFPHARIARLDRDTALRKGYYTRVYRDFSNEDIDILLGTQIVTKGFDFPRVTLVGVIEADTALHVPDFRSAERTFQLLTQVAGRAGRGSFRGEIIVQTFYPDHYALKTASQHDYEGFYRHEIKLREEVAYPPFKRLLSLIFRGYQQLPVRSECERMADFLNTRKEMSFELLGPSPAIRPMLHGKHRWQIIVKTEHVNSKDILCLAKNWQVKKGVLLSVEIDPVSLL